MGFLSSLFGGDGGTTTSTSQSWTETIQQDQRVTAEGAELVAGAGAVIALPSSVAVGSQASVGDIIIEQYTPEVQKTVGEIIEAFTESSERATEIFAETSQEVTEVLGEKLLTTQQGVASILPEMAKYLAIAAVAIVIAWKVLK